MNFFFNPLDGVTSAVKFVAIAAAVIAVVTIGYEMIGSFKDSGRLDVIQEGNEQRAEMGKKANKFKKRALKKAKPNSSMEDFDNLGR